MWRATHASTTWCCAWAAACLHTPASPTMGDLGTQPANEYASASRIILDLRGLCFVIDRETLMSLPESILLCLFPNGLMLPDPADESTDGEEGQVVYVDVRGWV